MNKIGALIGAPGAVAWVISPAGSISVNVDLRGVTTNFRRLQYVGH